MPPGRHSSSSHSSGSRSSFHSSSSHRSSGSSRSSFSHSGPGSHSFSSHKSFSVSGSGYRSSGSYSIYDAGANKKTKSVFSSSSLPRIRINQPRGYRPGRTGSAPSEYHCRNHDYIFYNTSWYDDQDGCFYKKGFYDEDGNWYDDILIRDKSAGEIRFICQYCGTEVKSKWTQGAKPTCPNCSAQLEEAKIDDVVPQNFWQRMDGELKTKIVCYSILGVICLGLGIPGCIAIQKTLSAPTPTVTQPANCYYVMGRKCDWLDEYESYYDPVTDCYFWYNDEIDIPGWQYWYEGISSDFGDCGWMEYDEEEQRWYIEVSDGNWIVLPDKYPTDKLWHIQESRE